MSVFSPSVIKVVNAHSEALKGILDVMYEMALILIKIESNDTIFEFIEEYQKTIKGGKLNELD